MAFSKSKKIGDWRAAWTGAAYWECFCFLEHISFWSFGDCQSLFVASFDAFSDRSSQWCPECEFEDCRYAAAYAQSANAQSASSPCEGCSSIPWSSTAPCLGNVLRDDFFSAFSGSVEKERVVHDEIHAEAVTPALAGTMSMSTRAPANANGGSMACGAKGGAARLQKSRHGTGTSSADRWQYREKAVPDFHASGFSGVPAHVSSMWPLMISSMLFK